MPDWLSPELVTAVLTVIGFVAGIFLKGPAGRIAGVLIDLAKEGVKRLWPGRSPAALTPGEQIAQDKPVIVGPRPGTPQAALQATIDARIAQRLGASIELGPADPNYVPPPPLPVKEDLKRALRKPLMDPQRQEFRRVVLKARYELQEAKCGETDQGRVAERAQVSRELEHVAAWLEG